MTVELHDYVVSATGRTRAEVCLSAWRTLQELVRSRPEVQEQLRALYLTAEGRGILFSARRAWRRVGIESAPFDFLFTEDERGNMSDLTWPCHVCGEERPNAQIAVYQRDDSEAFGRPAGTVPHNIRYCKDRPSCVAGAPEARRIKGGDDAPAFEVKRT